MGRADAELCAPMPGDAKVMCAKCFAHELCSFFAYKYIIKLIASEPSRGQSALYHLSAKPPDKHGVYQTTTKKTFSGTLVVQTTAPDRVTKMDIARTRALNLCLVKAFDTRYCVNQ